MKHFRSKQKGNSLIWTFFIPVNANLWPQNGFCTCPHYPKCFVCKRTIGIEIGWHLVVFSPEAKNIPLGEKQKRSALKKASKGSIVDSSFFNCPR
jgi:hypothetical protein